MAQKLNRTSFLILFLIFIYGCEKKETATLEFNYGFKYAPYLKHAIDYNNQFKNKYIYLINRQDTVFKLYHDYLGRVNQVNQLKIEVEKTTYSFFKNSLIVINKELQSDYTLGFNSILNFSSDTLLQLWKNPLGNIIDTFIYIQNNDYSKFYYSNLDDHQKIKYFSESEITNGKLNMNKIITISKPVYEEDSIIKSISYEGDKVKLVTEVHYSRNPRFSYTDSIKFDTKGFPIQYIDRDTIKYEIKW